MTTLARESETLRTAAVVYTLNRVVAEVPAEMSAGLQHQQGSSIVPPTVLGEALQ